MKRKCVLVVALGLIAYGVTESAVADQMRSTIATDVGAVGDGVTLNTVKLQAAIDNLATCRCAAAEVDVCAGVEGCADEGGDV